MVGIVDVRVILGVVHVDVAFLFTHHIPIAEQVLELVWGLLLLDCVLVVLVESCYRYVGSTDLVLYVVETLITAQFRGQTGLLPGVVAAGSGE